MWVKVLNDFKTPKEKASTLKRVEKAIRNNLTLRYVRCHGAEPPFALRGGRELLVGWQTKRVYLTGFHLPSLSLSAPYQKSYRALFGR